MSPNLRPLYEKAIKERDEYAAEVARLNAIIADNESGLRRENETLRGQFTAIQTMRDDAKAEVTRLTKENEWIKAQFLAVMNGVNNLHWTWEHLESLLKQSEQPAAAPKPSCAQCGGTKLVPLGLGEDRLVTCPKCAAPNAQSTLGRLVSDEPNRRKAILSKFDEDHPNAAPQPGDIIGVIRKGGKLPIRKTHEFDEPPAPRSVQELLDWTGDGNDEPAAALPAPATTFPTSAPGMVDPTGRLIVPSPNTARPGPDDSDCCDHCPKYGPCSAGVLVKCILPNKEKEQPATRPEPSPAAKAIDKVTDELMKYPAEEAVQMLVNALLSPEAIVGARKVQQTAGLENAGGGKEQVRLRVIEPTEPARVNGAGVIFGEKSDGFMNEKVIDPCETCGHGRDQHTSIGCWGYGCPCRAQKERAHQSTWGLMSLAGGPAGVREGILGRFGACKD